MNRCTVWRSCARKDRRDRRQTRQKPMRSLEVDRMQKWSEKSNRIRYSCEKFWAGYRSVREAIDFGRTVYLAPISRALALRSQVRVNHLCARTCFRHGKQDYFNLITFLVGYQVPVNEWNLFRFLTICGAAGAKNWQKQNVGKMIIATDKTLEYSITAVLIVSRLIILRVSSPLTRIFNLNAFSDKRTGEIDAVKLAYIPFLCCPAH